MNGDELQLGRGISMLQRNIEAAQLAIDNAREFCDSLIAGYAQLTSQQRGLMEPATPERVEFLNGHANGHIKELAVIEAPPKKRMGRPPGVIDSKPREKAPRALTDTSALVDEYINSLPKGGSVINFEVKEFVQAAMPKQMSRLDLKRVGNRISYNAAHGMIKKNPRGAGYLTL